MKPKPDAIFQYIIRKVIEGFVCHNLAIDEYLKAFGNTEIGALEKYLRRVEELIEDK